MTSAFSRLIIPLFFLCLFSLNSHAESKPNLVLLPIDVSENETEFEGEYGSALQQGLQTRYTVFYGAAVENELEKEYGKIDCNTETCNQNVAIAFNGDLIADSSVKRTSNGYLLKMVIRNVITGEVIETETVPCRNCDELLVITTLKEIGAGVQRNALGNARFVANQKTVGAKAGRIDMVTTKVTGNTSSKVAIVILKSEPKGAEVYIGGQHAGNTPFQVKGLQAPQILDVTFKYRNYHDKKLQLAIKGGINEAPMVELNPAFGSLQITSEPSDAEVYLAGKKVGVTPYLHKKQPSKGYFLSLHKPLYSAVENQTIQVKDSQATKKHYVLSQNYGLLEIKEGTEGAFATISRSQTEDENDKAFSMIKGVVPMEVNLKPGAYQVTMSKKGYESKSANVQIVNNESQTISRKQASLRQFAGTVMVSTENYVEGAKIYANGEYRGKAPALLTLPIGEYQIEIKHKDATAEKRVKVQDGKEEAVNLVLEKEEVYSPNVTAREPMSTWFFGTRAAYEMIFIEDTTAAVDMAQTSTMVPLLLIVDILFLPSTSVSKIIGSDQRVSSTLRPSTWAIPNSMIAKASKLQQKNKQQLSAESSQEISQEKSNQGLMNLALASSD